MDAIDICCVWHTLEKMPCCVQFIPNSMKPKASLSMHSRDDAWLGGALRYRGYGGWTLCLNDGCTVGWDNVPSQMVEGKGEKEGEKERGERGKMDRMHSTAIIFVRAALNSWHKSNTVCR